MADNTPILGLKKPVPNVEVNWAFRLNESLDILDQSLLVGNASSTANVTTYNSGTGLLLISGSTNPIFEHVEAITYNSDFVTVGSGTFYDVDSTYVTATSGSFDEVVVNGVELSLASPVDNSFKRLFHVADRKPNDTDGGTFSSGAWRVRTLNSVENDSMEGDASLSSNTITLIPGTYFIEWRCPAYRVLRHQSILYNLTGGYTQIQGTSEYSHNSYNTQTVSFGTGVFTVTETTDFQIWHRCETSSTTFGFGVGANFGIDEIYTEVKIWPYAAYVTALDTLVATSGTFSQGLTLSGVPVSTGTHTVIPDHLTTLSGTFVDELTVSGVPVTTGIADPLTVQSGTFTQGLTVPVTSGTDNQVWIDPTTSGLRWQFNGVVFEATGVEVA